jgi:plasmid stabilization system protein ParE
VKPVALHPEAVTEIEDAAAYLERQRPGMGRAFREEIAQALVSIGQTPAAFSPYRDTGFRKRLLHRFSYTLYFTETDEGVWVAAVAHQRRQPDYWLGRSQND